MGNTKSTQRKNRTRRKDRRRRPQEESDSEDEEIKDTFILEIDRRPESLGVISPSSQVCEDCDGMYGTELISIKDFCLDSLPAPLRDQRILDFIFTQEKIAVKLEVIKTQGGRKGMDFASGWACVTKPAVEVYEQCPIKDCSVNGGKPHTAYGGITVYTNKHVVTDNSEAAGCEVSFFYNGSEADNNNEIVGPLKSSEKCTTGLQQSETTVAHPRPECVGGGTLSDVPVLRNTTASNKNYVKKILVEATDFAENNPSKNLVNQSLNQAETSLGNNSESKSYENSQTKTLTGAMLQVENCPGGVYVKESHQVNFSVSDAAPGPNPVLITADPLPPPPNPDTNRPSASPTRSTLGSTPHPSLTIDQSNTAQGFYLQADRANKDLVAMSTVFHNPELFGTVSLCSWRRLQSWARLPASLQAEMKKHAVVISHPHGRSKVVSVGRLQCLEAVGPQGATVRETRYFAATCRGSSGAPVFSGHYPDRPFTHSGKRKKENQVLNMSLSY